MSAFLDVYEPPTGAGDEETIGQLCPLCLIRVPDEGEHWSTCPLAPNYLTADDDPDADESVRSLEIM